MGRAFVILCSHIRIFVGVPLKEVVPLQVGIESIRIDWARSCQACLLLRTQPQPDLARNRLGYIVLDIEDEHAIRGFHAVALSEQGYERTPKLLDSMGFRKVGEEGAYFSLDD